MTMTFDFLCVLSSYIVFVLYVKLQPMLDDTVVWDSEWVRFERKHHSFAEHVTGWTDIMF